MAILGENDQILKGRLPSTPLGLEVNRFRPDNEGTATKGWESWSRLSGWFRPDNEGTATFRFFLVLWQLLWFRPDNEGTATFPSQTHSQVG